MKTFIFESYDFNADTRTAEFNYSFDHEHFFTEKIVFAQSNDQYDQAALERALFLSFVLVGVSYCKLFPRVAIEWREAKIDTWQAEFLNTVYQEGLGQYAFENGLGRKDLAQFLATGSPQDPVEYRGEGILSLQSGGKDSLLTAETLNEQAKEFVAFYISNSGSYPALLNTIGARLLVARRYVDIEAIKTMIRDHGALNGHIPVTYIVLSFALIQTVLLNRKTVLASIGHEGEEPHAWIEDLPVNHQWSKTWHAEQLLSEYVRRYIAPEIEIGSPLRKFTELRIAELFVQKAWTKYGHVFSSCNVANYQLGTDNTELKWCGNCPKCANSYLLFASFLEPIELQSIFNGQELFEKPALQDIFKGLLGIDGVMKPFECVGEIEELRLAYHMAQNRGGYGRLEFEVPESTYDYMQQFPSQVFSDLQM